MNKYTKQYIADRFYDEFLNEKNPDKRSRCVNESGRCRYRHEGNYCAVGMLIPDEMYDSIMENRPASTLFERNEKFRELFAEGSNYDWAEFLDGLQMIHDEMNINDGIKMYEEFCDTWSLDCAV